LIRLNFISYAFHVAINAYVVKIYLLPMHNLRQREYFFVYDKGGEYSFKRENTILRGVIFLNFN
jgi:hypothetical protein